MGTRLAIALLLAAAPAAQARSYSVPAPVSAAFDVAGYSNVALADGQVLWVEQRATGAALVAAAEDGVPHDVATLAPVAGPLRVHTVVAAGTTAFFARHVCAARDCDRAAAADLLRVDLTTGATAPFDGCLGDAACRACPDGSQFAVGLRGTVLTATGLCTREDGVTDLADGATRRFGQHVVAAAGRFAVRSVEGHSTDTLLVVDWRTGATVSRVRGLPLDPLARDVALAADGTLAWTQSDSVRVLPPGATRPREVVPAGDAVPEVELVGGLLALRHRDGAGGNELRVSRADGSGARRVDGQYGRFGWAFDGTRLAWVAQPCAQPVVQVWDLATDPPVPADARCASARVGAVRLVGRELRIRLSCPRDAPARGCAGLVSATLSGRTRAETAPQSYRLEPGATRIARLDLNRRVRGPLVARVTVNDTSTRRRVRG